MKFIETVGPERTLFVFDIAFRIMESELGKSSLSADRGEKKYLFYPYGIT
jgi:hypothetical protein